MLVPRGSPVKGGAVIARGAVVDLPEVWAVRFIADGTAIEETKTAKAAGPVSDKDPKAPAKGKKK